MTRPKLTAATITDAQIREEILSHPQLVIRALLPNKTGTRYARRIARERLAWILNNRPPKGTKP